jgi:hypothetical protein
MLLYEYSSLNVLVWFPEILTGFPGTKLKLKNMSIEIILPVHRHAVTANYFWPLHVMNRPAVDVTVNDEDLGNKKSKIIGMTDKGVRRYQIHLETIVPNGSVVDSYKFTGSYREKLLDNKQISIHGYIRLDGSYESAYHGEFFFVNSSDREALMRIFANKA